MPKITREALNQHISSYFHSEKKGSELIEKLIDFAPGEEEKEWIRIWSKEEAHHHILWDSVARARGLEPLPIEHNVQKLFDITEDYVNKKDWAGAMVGASVIEHLSNAAAAYLYHDSDDDMKRVFRRIVGDDLGHLDFDMYQIGKIAQTEEGRRKILDIHKKFLNEIIEWPLRPNTSEIDIDILNGTYELHRNEMMRVGIKLPNIHFSRGASFRVKRSLIKLFAR